MMKFESNKKILIVLENQKLIQIINALKILDSAQVQYNITEEYPKNNLPTIDYEKMLGVNGIKILELLSKGYSYNDIKNEMGISIDSVRYWIKKIFTRLNVNNGCEAVNVYLSTIKNKKYMNLN